VNNVSVEGKELEKPPRTGVITSMSTVEEIRTAIKQLSLEERAEITAELCGWTDDDWDLQMKSDMAAGKFSKVNEEADAAYRAGQTRPLEDLLRKP
jgi:hypothetical protein